MRLFIFTVFCNFIVIAILKADDQVNPFEEQAPGGQCTSIRRSNNEPVSTPLSTVPTQPSQNDRVIPNPLLNSNEDLLATVKRQDTERKLKILTYVDNLSKSSQATDDSKKCKPDSESEIEGGQRRSMSGFDDDDSDSTYNFNGGEIGDMLLRNSKNPTNALDTKVENLDDRNSLDRPLSEDDEARRGWPLADPAFGQVTMENARPLLMSGDRVCYACSTVNNPRCWDPDRSTTVKYCRKGHDACVTKSFGKGKSYTLIRDCGTSCEQSDIEGFLPKYKSCKICQNDLCNGAYSINSYNLLYSLILFGVIKYTF